MHGVLCPGHRLRRVLRDERVPQHERGSGLREPNETEVRLKHDLAQKLEPRCGERLMSAGNRAIGRQRVGLTELAGRRQERLAKCRRSKGIRARIALNAEAPSPVWW